MAKSRMSGRRALLTGSGAFFLAILVSSGSQVLLGSIKSLIIAFILLVLIILTGIVFDIIGVAATAAEETGLNAKAARRVMGARQAQSLVRNAHSVSSFCNDIIGDISATLSGAIGAAIVFRLADRLGGNSLWMSIFMTAIISGLTVGGKAWGKGFAIGQANETIFQVGRLIAWVQRLGALARKTRGKR